MLQYWNNLIYGRPNLLQRQEHGQKPIKDKQPIAWEYFDRSCRETGSG